MIQWLDLWKNSSSMRSLLDGLKKGWPLQSIQDVAGSATGYLVASLIHLTGRTFLVVVPTGRKARQLVEEMSFWLSGSEAEVLHFPSLEVLPDEVLAQSLELEGARLRALETLLFGSGPKVVVSSAPALARRLSPAEVFRAQIRVLSRGDMVDLDQLASRLAGSGYERSDMVTAPGHFAVRGGILDVFPPAVSMPFRLELFGDEIDSIREFDPADQRSRDAATQVMVGPARELVFGEDHRRRAEERIRMQALDQPRGSAARQRGLEAAELLSEGASPRAVASYLSFFFEDTHTLPEYLPPSALTVVSEPARLREAFEEATEDFILRQTDLLDRGDVLPGQAEVYTHYGQVWRQLAQRQMIMCQGLPGKVADASPLHTITAGGRDLISFRGQWPLIKEGISELARRRFRILAVAGGEERARRLIDRLEEEGLKVSAALRPGAVTVTEGGSVAESFEIPGLELAVVGEGSLFGSTRSRLPRKSQATAGQKALLSDLAVGDYVVHVHHGVGQYMGLRTQIVDGVRKEYLYLRYQGQDRLYVPVEQIDMVQKYVGQEGRTPSLHRLGTAEWSRVKSRVKKSVREMAGELLALYAAREKTPGHAFSADGPWQSEFEESFSHEETPDQIRAAREIKGDMESPRPMDRLLCGDVGYGKTEVALRAAFKATFCVAMWATERPRWP